MTKNKSVFPPSDYLLDPVVRTLAEPVMTRRRLKCLINADRWHEIGEYFKFTPRKMLVGKKWVIDWCCIPTAMVKVLQSKEPDQPRRKGPPSTGSSNRAFTFRDQKGICHYCKQDTEYKQWSVDHKLPKSRGGQNDFSNLVGACKNCNQEKGKLTEVEYFEVLRIRESKAKENDERKTQRDSDGQLPRPSKSGR